MAARSPPGGERKERGGGLVYVRCLEGVPNADDKQKEWHAKKGGKGRRDLNTKIDP